RLISILTIVDSSLCDLAFSLLMLLTTPPSTSLPVFEDSDIRFPEGARNFSALPRLETLSRHCLYQCDTCFQTLNFQPQMTSCHPCAAQRILWVHSIYWLLAPVG